jgi:lipopolysaccharide export system permease protein
MLRRYALAEFLRKLALAGGVFTGLMILMMAVRLARRAERYGTDLPTLLGVVPYLLPYLLTFSVPMAFLVAAVLAFGKLESTGEVLAARAAGVRLTGIVWPVLATALAASAVIVFLTDAGVDWGFDRARERVLSSGGAAVLRRAESGKTFVVDTPGRSWRVHRFGERDGREPLAIVEFRRGSVGEVVLAREHALDSPSPEVHAPRGGTGTRPDGGKWDLLRFRLGVEGGSGARAGWIEITRPGEAALAESGEFSLAVESAAERRRSFADRNYARGLSENVRDARRSRERLGELEREELDRAAGLAALLAAGLPASARAAATLDEAVEAADLSRHSLDAEASRLRSVEVEVHRKLSTAFAPLAFALLGIPLGLALGRGGHLTGFAVGIALIAFVYYPLWMLGQGLASSGVLPCGVGVWAAPVLVGACGAVWLSRVV